MLIVWIIWTNIENNSCLSETAQWTSKRTNKNLNLPIFSIIWKRLTPVKKPKTSTP